jgi:hypothetical protein
MAVHQHGASSASAMAQPKVAPQRLQMLIDLLLGTRRLGR